MKMKESGTKTSHINAFHWVLAEISSQGLIFEEEIETPALLSCLWASWEVFCTTITNRSLKLTLEETIETIFSEDI